MSETDHKALAAQLRCPSGVTGEKTAENMFVATGFGQPACLEYEEKIMSNAGHETIRPFVIVTGIK